MFNTIVTPRRTRAFFGHHKCATTWLNHIISGVCRNMSLEFSSVHNPSMFSGDLTAFVEENGIDFISYVNAKLEHVQHLDARGFHVVRDPRDILVSAYYSHRYSHPTGAWPELLERRDRLQSVSKEEGFVLEMDFLEEQFEDMYDWNYDRENILEVKMEEMIRQPYEMLVQVFEFLGLVDGENDTKGDVAAFYAHYLLAALRRRLGLRAAGVRPKTIPVHELLRIVYANRFSAKTNGRARGEEDVHAHFRKGVAGDWVNHFTPDHRAEFKRRYNDLLLKLNYERDPDW